ncbi:MAG: YicC family protein [Clostridia bacterium]|nr:YicC family protein [Clostridia bacterium]
MLSMTGYGKGEFELDGITLTCEMRSVNNRYLDVVIKCPRIFTAYEEVIRATIKEKMTRGHVDVFISYKDKREKPTNLAVDLSVATAYVMASQSLKDAFPYLTDDVTLTSLMRYPDVLRQEEDVASADESMITALKGALGLAIDNLNSMRAVEGEKLKADMLSRVGEVERLVNCLSERAPMVAKNHREKLAAKIKEYLGEAQVDESRILTEAAIFADKSNVDEELTRLYSHISQFRDICKEKIVGRKLDFLVQEFNREANTTCSKSNDVEVTRLGLALKNEIEKIREQVQNVE